MAVWALNVNNTDPLVATAELSVKTIQDSALKKSGDRLNEFFTVPDFRGSSLEISEVRFGIRLATKELLDLKNIDSGWSDRCLHTK